jgi:hypothetical protein
MPKRNYDAIQDEEIPNTLMMFNEDERRFFVKYKMLWAVKQICFEEWMKANFPSEPDEPRIPF